MPEDETKETDASIPEDTALKMMNARRMLALRKRANTAARAETEAKSPKPPSDREVLLRALVDRGDEVLRYAEGAYPREMAILVPKLASLVRSKQVPAISGGDLLQFLRSIGLRVSVPTTISVTEHGKTVSLAEKLKKEIG